MGCVPRATTQSVLTRAATLCLCARHRHGASAPSRWVRLLNSLVKFYDTPSLAHTDSRLDDFTIVNTPHERRARHNKQQRGTASNPKKKVETEANADNVRSTFFECFSNARVIMVPKNASPFALALFVPALSFSSNGAHDHEKYCAGGRAVGDDLTVVAWN